MIVAFSGKITSGRSFSQTKIIIDNSGSCSCVPEKEGKLNKEA
ncbi:hypothetical protein [Candidatus Phytoplasma solani]